MHKLVILIEPLADWNQFEEAWPQFLRQVEAMPGLQREATSRVEVNLFGNNYAQMHELYFDSLPAARDALSSPEGRAAGRLLQAMTGGRLAIFLADYREDDLDHIRQYRAAAPEGEA